MKSSIEWNHLHGTSVKDTALEALSAHQDAAAARGRQETYSQSRIGRTLGLTRSRVEQLETVAKLRFIQKLAQHYPQSFLDLGGTIEQLAFLTSITVTAASARHLWRRWCRLGG
jgi:hypothetical protein